MGVELHVAELDVFGFCRPPPLSLSAFPLAWFCVVDARPSMHFILTPWRRALPPLPNVRAQSELCTSRMVAPCSSSMATPPEQQLRRWC